jgi:hypothetical protein
LRAQLDVVVQFLMGCFVDPDYVDSYRLIALRNLTSLSGFWFDCVTSMPWSYMDYYAYQARAARRDSGMGRFVTRNGWVDGWIGGWVDHHRGGWMGGWM